jgi:hypothetical protein
MKVLSIALLAIVVFVITFTILRYLEIYSTFLDWFLIIACSLIVFTDFSIRKDLIKGILLSIFVCSVNYFNSFFIMAFFFKDGL